MSNNIYNILGKLKTLTESAEPAAPEATVYESVEARGSITEAVRSLEAKFQTFKESAKPDFLDVDKDGDKAEPFKKAVKDKKQVEEAAKPDFLDMDKDGDKKEPMKKAVKDKNNAKGAMKDMFGGDAKDLTSKLKIKEGQGPYELYNPKHPKFKANYDKYKAKHPDCTLADFVDAMKKREAKMNEAAYDEPEAPNADAIAKRKRLQAIKDRQEDERAMGGSKETNTPIRKVAGKAYGGAAQKDDASDLDEVAPPGAKAERMVKHIKKGYADDGKLTKREKGIAYATAWKAHNKGQVEEGVEFKDAGKIKNSAPDMKKAKLAKVTESRVMEETDYFYEKVAKSLCAKNSNLDTAGSEFADAVRKEMIAQGIEPNRARNILLMDEDFLGDVATSYGHYCNEVSEAHAPMNSHLGGMNELDEIARLAGLPVQETDMVYDEVNYEESADTMDEGSLPTELDEAASRKDFRQVANLLANIPDSAKRAELAKHHAEIFKQQNPRFSFDKFYAAAGVNPDDALLPNPPAEITIDEADMSEGNEFSGALAAAKASGAKEFEVDGKKYTVKEDINVNITANGQEDALNLFRKLAGMEEVAQPVAQVVELPQDAESAIAQGMVEVEVDEERDIEYVNTPNEKIAPVSASIPNGNDLHKSKQSYSDKPYRGDNPMAVKEATDDSLWKKYSGMLKSLIIK
jgi:hypothetical protein